jgi:hypothetical protein
MNSPQIPNVWQKSSRSQNTSDCVEVALGPVVGIRDTKARRTGQLAVPARSWAAFLADVTADRKH